MNIKERKNILVTCGPGLKDYLLAELEGLGFEIVSSHAGGVVTRGSFIDCMKLNFCLRTAYNVLYLLKEFRCGSSEALYRQVNILPWENIIAPEEYLCVLSRVDTWSINNSMYPSLKVKDAIVDRINKKTGSRPDSGPDRTKAVVNLFWKEHRAWIYLNTSGIKLSDRNYRKMPHIAPLRESLAAGIIMATGYDGSQDIVLPMCGSGTLAIESAFIGMNKPAGILRSNFGFKHFKVFDKQIWEEIRNDARKSIDAGALRKRIIATDIDKQAIEAAKQNARTAGVEHLIEFNVCDFADTEVPEGAGIVVINPEYGERLGELEPLEKEYKRIGDFFKKKCAGYTGYLLTGNLQLAKKVGLKACRRMIFYNGKIECRLLKYELYKGTRQTPDNPG
ncbi:MAG: class I SAM-dependent RNA methyltransferase [Planctomycetes bacterium]|nr:class I SAM-dependent RNA methyltransferase [Planctomycetota bacterium]